MPKGWDVDNWGYGWFFYTDKGFNYRSTIYATENAAIAACKEYVKNTRKGCDETVHYRAY